MCVSACFHASNSQVVLTADARMRSEKAGVPHSRQMIQNRVEKKFPSCSPGRRCAACGALGKQNSRSAVGERGAALGARTGAPAGVSSAFTTRWAAALSPSEPGSGVSAFPLCVALGTAHTCSFLWPEHSTDGVRWHLYLRGGGVLFLLTLFFFNSLPFSACCSPTKSLSVWDLEKGYVFLVLVFLVSLLLSSLSWYSRRYVQWLWALWLLLRPWQSVFVYTGEVARAVPQPCGEVAGFLPEAPFCGRECSCCVSAPAWWDSAVLAVKHDYFFIWCFFVLWEDYQVSTQHGKE